MRFEIENKEEFLETPIGAICGSMIDVIEDENIGEGVMVMIFTKENGEGYRFDLSVEKVNGEKSLKDKLKFW